MAKQIITKLVDDIDGGEAHETIRFGLDGATYEIDLSEKNADRLRTALEPFVESGTIDRGGKALKPSKRGTYPTKADPDKARIREWANDNGYDVALKGRIPGYVVDAYQAAQEAPSLPTATATATATAVKRARQAK